MRNLKLVVATIGGFKTDHTLSAHFLPGSEGSLIDKVKIITKNKIEQYKAEARHERETKQVLQMSDSMLKDIGLNPADLDRLRAGQTSLKELNDRRESYRNQFV